MVNSIGVYTEIHHTFEDQSPVVEVLETGIKVIDLLGTLCKRW